ncbi:hypothetical protein ACFY05_01065 [Microtetraspora fusca]|uniref:Uncharacterized protein n=1 Tax=Microtetraspora fusca TaxID=1997 RepID=A0ABW6V0J1_MICFU
MLRALPALTPLAFKAGCPDFQASVAERVSPATVPSAPSRRAGDAVATTTVRVRREARERTEAQGVSA